MFLDEKKKYKARFAKSIYMAITLQPYSSDVKTIARYIRPIASEHEISVPKRR